MILRRNESFFVLHNDDNVISNSLRNHDVDHFSQSGRSRTIVNGLLNQSGRSWVKVDGHSIETGRFPAINRSVEVNGLR